MNELQKEYYERQAKEQAEREAAEEARLKAFMEEERRKDAERKFREEINKAEQEEKERLAAEEAERKAEEEAAEIINRMKAKIHEERAKEKEKEMKAHEIPIEMADDKKTKDVIQESDAIANESKPEEVRSVEPQSKSPGAEEPDTKVSESSDSQVPASATPDSEESNAKKMESEETVRETTADAKPKSSDTVKEVVKPASDGVKKQGSPKFKKGGKKKNRQQTGRPKPIEEPQEPVSQTEPQESQEPASNTMEQGDKLTKADSNNNTQNTRKEETIENEKIKEEPEVVNLEGTVEPAEEEPVQASESGNDAKAETSEEETVKKMTPEDKAASDEAAKWKEAAEEAQDRYKRLLAEFENARAREAKEATQKFDLGAKSVLEKLLPVVDNFERAIQTIPEEDRERAFEQGVDKIYKQMMKVLEDIGVAPMNAEGTEFNPDLHNAVMHIEDESLGENVVAEEMQKGYMYKDSVLRYSMVKVAN